MSETRRISKKKAELAELGQAAFEKKACSNGLDFAVVKQDDRIITLMTAIAEYKTQLASLTQALDDKGVQISKLEEAAAAGARQIEVLTQASIKKDIFIQQLQSSTNQLGHWLGEAHKSFGWKLFKPVRTIRNLLMRFSGKMDVALIPLITLPGGMSSASDEPTQFLLIAKRAWHRVTGWYWLELDSVAEQPVKIGLYFDVGGGFDSTRVINFVLTGKGQQKLPLFVPADCCAISLAPCDAPATFKLDVCGLTKPKSGIECTRDFLEQSTAYEAWGGREGNAAPLVPLNDVKRASESGYCWRSESDDPSFELAMGGPKLRAGWYIIELRVRLNINFGNAKLYLDYGAGYHETSSVTLPFTNGQDIKRLYYLDTTPHKIRFDPLETAAEFSVERLHFVPVKAATAYRCMLKHLHTYQSRAEDSSTKNILRDLRTHAKTTKTSVKEVLYRRYNESYLDNSIGYEQWIGTMESTASPDFANIEIMKKTFLHHLIISVIVPTYNTAEIFLRRAIESVLAQSYPSWELCIADDASTQPHVRHVLEEYARQDKRIKLIFRSENGHISATSNSALALATGEYVALLDHDDELAQHALLFMMEAINKNPSAQILYSDEDKIDAYGKRSSPHFKPDWNPDLFFSQNYVSHLGVYRRALLEHIGGFRTGVEGSQDQDLLLRCLPHVKPAQILHIPKVLYHWRMLEGSTARTPQGKTYTTEAGIKALRDFFSVQAQDDVKVEAGLLPNTYRVRYPLPKPAPLISLLIPTRDALDMLAPCVQSILEKTIYPNYEIVILDNDSVQPATHRYFEKIQAKHARVRVLPYPNPFNFSAINNYGVQHARGEVIGLVNNDIKVISAEWLSEMISHVLRPEIGCVGAKLYYDDETIQHAGIIVGLGGVAGHSHKNFRRASNGYYGRLKVIQNLSAVTAACLVVRKSVYEQVGGLEENNLRVAFNDVDFCLKVREAGYRNLWTPYAELYHYESKSRGAEDTPEKQARFRGEIEFITSKWGELLRGDPCYSEHLTLAREDFSIGA